MKRKRSPSYYTICRVLPRRAYLRWHMLREMYSMWLDSHEHRVRKMRGVVVYKHLKKRVRQRVDFPSKGSKQMTVELRELEKDGYLHATVTKDKIWNIYLTDAGLELAEFAFLSHPSDYYRTHDRSEYIANRHRRTNDIRLPAPSRY
jgi:cytolysin (calcineurin-like family phosphatase)